MTSIIEIQNFVIIFQNIEIIDTSIEILNDRIMDQLKIKIRNDKC